MESFQRAKHFVALVQDFYLSATWFAEELVVKPLKVLKKELTAILHVRFEKTFAPGASVNDDGEPLMPTIAEMIETAERRVEKLVEAINELRLYYLFRGWNMKAINMDYRLEGIPSASAKEIILSLELQKQLRKPREQGKACLGKSIIKTRSIPLLTLEETLEKEIDLDFTFGLDPSVAKDKGAPSTSVPRTFFVCGHNGVWNVGASLDDMMKFPEARRILKDIRDHRIGQNYTTRISDVLSEYHEKEQAQIEAFHKSKKKKQQKPPLREIRQKILGDIKERPLGRSNEWGQAYDSLLTPRDSCYSCKIVFSYEMVVKSYPVEQVKITDWAWSNYKEKANACAEVVTSLKCVVIA